MHEPAEHADGRDMPGDGGQLKTAMVAEVLEVVGDDLVGEFFPGGQSELGEFDPEVSDVPA